MIYGESVPIVDVVVLMNEASKHLAVSSKARTEYTLFASFQTSTRKV